MYTTVLLLHSWLRWVALVAGVAATVLAMRGTPGPTGDARRPLGAGVVSLDLQMLLGLLLYFVVSPTMAAIRENFGASMKDPVARFWAVEHITTMMVAVVVVHVGRVLGAEGDAGFEADEAVRLLRHRDGADAAGDSVARHARRTRRCSASSRFWLRRMRTSGFSRTRLSMNESELVTVATFPSAVDAEIAKGVLDEVGIESMIRSDNAGGMYPSISGAEFVVRAEDAEKAAEALGLGSIQS